MRGVLGWLLAQIVRALVATFRVHLVVDRAFDGARGPFVFAFFHGTQLPLLAYGRRRATAVPTVVMVSLSKDGALQAGVMAALGFRVVRGSTSRQGARALRRVIGELRSGADAAFAIDGPRGPYGAASGGASTAAKLARGSVVPMGISAAPSVTLRAWDRFVVPLPFARVVVCVGAPLPSGGSREEVARAVHAANARAAVAALPDVSSAG